MGPRTCLSDLTGKVAVVTGAGSGVGAALAAALVAEGMRLVLLDRDGHALADVAGQLSDDPLTLVCDVTSAGDLEAAAGHVHASCQNVHLLVNNAGVMPDMAPSWLLAPEQWRQTFDVNLMGIVNGLHAFLPKMLEQPDSGYVVNTASEAAFEGRAFVAAYHASKHAVLALTESLAQELAFLEAQIGVSVLCPGAIDTRLLDQPPATTADTPGGRLSDVYRRSLRRGMNPADVAATVIDGVRTGRFYLLPHPEVAELPQSRADAVREDRYPELAEGLARLLRETRT